jgi:hypothetical protein
VQSRYPNLGGHIVQAYEDAVAHKQTSSALHPEKAIDKAERALVSAALIYIKVVRAEAELSHAEYNHAMNYMRERSWGRMYAVTLEDLRRSRRMRACRALERSQVDCIVYGRHLPEIREEQLNEAKSAASKAKRNANRKEASLAGGR